MAPKEMTLEEKEAERKIILDSAMNMVKEKGYNKISMREVAKSCNFTATKIYYYFINKEHIIFNLSEICFDELRGYLIDELEKYDTNELKFRNLLLGLYKFCTDKPYYYDLMFGIDIPKCSDFSDNELISNSARDNMIAAIRFNGFAHTIVKAYANEAEREFSEDFSLSIIARIIGIIQLQNSKIFREINVDGNNIINITIDSIDELIRYKLYGDKKEDSDYKFAAQNT